MTQKINLSIGKMMTPELRTRQQNQKLRIALGGYAVFLAGVLAVHAKAGVGVFGDGSYIPAIRNIYIDAGNSFMPMIENQNGTTTGLWETNKVLALGITNIINRNVNKRARRKALDS